jgi:PadR family transcriptional regulator PadR
MSVRGRYADFATPIVPWRAPSREGLVQLPQITPSKFDTVIGVVDGGYLLTASAHQRDLFTGFIRIHVLVHAAHEPLFGLVMMEELVHHGCRTGPGTLYPLLHGMGRNGLLVSKMMNVGGRRRRVYRLTRAGRKALEQPKAKVDELYHEIHGEHPRKISRE